MVIVEKLLYLASSELAKPTSWDSSPTNFAADFSPKCAATAVMIAPSSKCNSKQKSNLPALQISTIATFPEC
jgi:hypothetical protein